MCCVPDLACGPWVNFFLLNSSIRIRTPHSGGRKSCCWSLTLASRLLQARKALADRQKELELKTQQLEIKLSNKIEEDIKKARRKSTQAGQRSNQGGHSGVWGGALAVFELWPVVNVNVCDYRCGLTFTDCCLFCSPEGFFRFISKNVNDSLLQIKPRIQLFLEV